jgi:GDPmannose 4,6-dehydratase
MTSPTAVVLGCNGQDGTFLCRRLLRAGKGYVVGVGRQERPRESYDPSRFRYFSINLTGQSNALREVLTVARPQRIFHVAAVHASAGSAAYETVFESMLAVNVRSLHTVLEYLRTSDPAARLVYASSSKVFGVPPPVVVNERSPRVGACLYGITKNVAGDLIQYYRKAHGVLVSQLFLFNHESELRPMGFFIPKLVQCLRAADRRESTRHYFHTLQFYCDWGSADEYMGIMLEVIESAVGQDFVLATGRTVHARALVQGLFAARGLPMAEYVGETTNEAGPHYDVDIGKLKSIALYPKIGIEELVEGLVVSSSLNG